jgi:signal transduction histidine kinase/Flp pilus assembly protein TadD
MNKLLLTILLLAAIKLTGQTKADSLIARISKVAEPEKIAIYLELSEIHRSDSAKSISYAKMALNNAKKYKQADLKAKALFNLGETHYNVSEFNKAINDFQDALNEFSLQNDTLNMIVCYRLLGLCYHNLNQGEKAISKFIEGMKLCENDPTNTAKMLHNIGNTHTRMRNPKDAISNYYEALKINQSIANDVGMAFNYNGLGEVYKNLNQPDSALANYRRANKLNRKLDFQAITLSNMAGIYMSYVDSIPKAVECLKQSWAIFRKLGMLKHEAEFKQGIGIILFKQGKYKPAIEALKNSIEIDQKYNKGLKIKTTSTFLLSRVYERMGDFESSLKYMKQYVQYSDSIAQNEKYKEIAALEMQYQSERKENEIARLQAEQKLTLLQLRKNKQLKQLGMATALLLLLLVSFILLKYRDKHRSNQLLKEKNQLIEQSEHELRLLNASKNKFFSIIAHDLKNPLHNVLGYSFLLNKDYDRFSEDERRNFALKIHQSTNNIFRLLQNLLEWSRSQTGRLNFSPAVVDYQRILDNSLSVLRTLADQKNIRIKVENDPELKIFADPLMIETVMRNLINNAIKFTPEGGEVEVSAKMEDDQILVSVSDTGIGIPEEDTKNLFRIDSKVKRRGTNNEDGSGLGLILCHEFVNKHNGKIWVESTPGKGSEFVFSIPAKAIA